MLIKRDILDRVAAGEVTLAFRRWRRPTVKAGGRLRTPIGVLGIEGVDRIPVSAITDSDARRAGQPSAERLRAELERIDGGEVYRITFRLEGPDPRIALRRTGRLNQKDNAALMERLARLDRDRPWTRNALELIRDHSGVPASRLAATSGEDKARFKHNVRKLKELGLTESREVGYRLSPRGRAVLAFLCKSPRHR